MLYFKKKGYGAWLVECASDKGFEHYHGMLYLKNIDADRIDFIKKAIYKQINRTIGRSYPLEPCDDIGAWYNYIHGERNIVIQEYWQSAAPDIPPMLKKYNLD